MLEKLKIVPPIFDRRFDFDKEELSTIESIGRVLQVVNTIIDIVNGWQGQLDSHELSTSITNNRKLSPTGNFTGQLMGRMVSTVLSQVDTNKDKLLYLANQFSDGQTGLIIDGGFFEASGIDKNYDGGRF